MPGSRVIGGLTFSVSSANVSVGGKNALIIGDPFDSDLLYSSNAAPIKATLTSAGLGFTAVGGFSGDLFRGDHQTTLTLVGTSGVRDVRTVQAFDMGWGSRTDSSATG